MARKDMVMSLEFYTDNQLSDFSENRGRAEIVTKNFAKYQQIRMKSNVSQFLLRVRVILVSTLVTTTANFHVKHRKRVSDKC